MYRLLTYVLNRFANVFCVSEQHFVGLLGKNEESIIRRFNIMVTCFLRMALRIYTDGAEHSAPSLNQTTLFEWMQAPK